MLANGVPGAVDMSCELCGIRMRNPVIAASGAYAFGQEYNMLAPLSQLGGISCKGLTLSPREGNPPPRSAETPAGMLNSVGLANPGVDAFISKELPALRACDPGLAVIANAAGSTEEEYLRVVEALSDSDVDAIELNLSCPNVDKGGLGFGSDARSLSSVVSLVRPSCRKPLIVKLTPNVGDVSELAAAAEASGADAVSLINTIYGMKIDIRTRRPLLKRNVGGLSGPAVMPIAVRMVWAAASRVKVPVIGMGGISSGEDAVEFMLAGASAVMVGTACFIDPRACARVADGIMRYCERYGLASPSEIVGRLEAYEA